MTRLFGTIGLILFSALVCRAQVIDDFSDGDFISNPVWTPDNATNWTVVSNQLRSNSITASSTFSISTPSTQALNAQWEFYVNLQFNTSSANFVDVYLMSSNSTLNSANGYFVRIGGTPDEISLYKSTLGSSSILINGTDGITNSSNSILKIKITRNAANLWTLQRDVLGPGNNYFIEGTVIESSFSISSFFGIRITQSTASFFSKHFLDDFYVGPIILDTSPPILNSVSVVSSTELNLLFSENLDPTSSQITTNYSANSGIGNPANAALQPDQKTVKLTFGQAFANGIQNQLTLSGIKDLAGNAIVSSSLPFLYFAATPESKGDIVISEIFPDPDPVIGLPSAEFIEIYNRSNNPFDLNGWKLSDGTSAATFAAQVILPQQYWIVTSASNASLFAAYENVIGVSGFPSLNNSGDLLTLKGSSGLTVDSLNYASSWYRDSDKAQGGWTLEKIDLNKPSTASFNWVASQDATGGTPSKQNSWFGLNPDNQAPKLLTIIVTNDLQIDLQFDEDIDATTAAISNFNVNNGIGSPRSLTVSSYGKTISLTFTSKFQNGVENTISVSNIKDLAGNKIASTSSSFYYLIPTTPKAKDIIISEIFPDPDPIIGLPAAEFVEIYNRSNEPYDLNGWKISDGSSTAIFTSKILLPNKYLIVTSSFSLTLFSSINNVVGLANFPSLNNSGDLLTLKSKSGLAVDSLNYTFSWYRDEDKANGGWSLELIDPENICGEGNNWIASVDSKGGTPEKQNSVFANKPDLTGPKLLSIAATQSNQLLLAFDEKLEKPLGNLTFTTTPSIPISTFTLNNSALTEIKIELSQALVLRQLYNLQVSNLRDCAGNFIQLGFDKLDFALPETADSLDILVNEILFNPRPGGVDFVEIYNKSPKYINLRNHQIANYENGVIKSAKIVPSNLILAPSSFIAFTSDTAILKTQYLMSVSKSFYQMDLPSFNDDAGSIALVNDKGKVGDYFLYADQFHSPLLKDKEGVSLERISLTQNSNESSNWKSASAASGFATPGYLNSNSRPEAFVNENAIRVEPEIFSLQRSGQDFAKINYRFDQNGFVANVKILDQQGRLIKTITNNETLGFEGFFRWDGDRDDGNKARLGYYLVWVEIFDLTGTVKTFRERVVIAGD
jgi:Lamin Tail Domain/Bacterial Ig-like domain